MTRRWLSPRMARWLSGSLASVVLVAAVSGLVGLLGLRVPALYLLVLYVLVVMSVAIRWGTAVAAAAAVLSVGVYAYLFFPPIHSLWVDDWREAVALAVFLVTAVVVGELAARLRRAAMESARLTEEQSALRRVATLVAQSLSPSVVFEAVTREVGLLCGADLARMERYEVDGTVTGVAAWGTLAEQLAVGTRFDLDGLSVAREVLQSGNPVRLESFAGATGGIAREARGLGIRSSVGCPIVVAGHLWGVIAASTRRDEPFPANAEAQIASFTELVATAVANAQARVELRAIADEQAALRRVATLVARAAPPAAVFAAVAEEVAQVLPAGDLTVISRYDPDATVTVVAGWSRTGGPVPVGRRVSVSGRNVAALVLETGRTARLDYHDADVTAAVAAEAHALGIRSSVGAPISVEGRAWGVMTVLSTGEDPLPPDTEERLAGFTELVATAIADTQARAELRRVADEQAALRRVATLVARTAAPPAVFAAVAEEIGRLIPTDAALVNRYNQDGTHTVMGTWSSTGHPLALGERTLLGGENVTTLVYETGRPARVDAYTADDGGATTAAALRVGLRSAVGAPINVAGRLWGVMIAGSTREEMLPEDTETRLAGFTELVATAIANAEAHAELTASRARIVAAADGTRRRIERDLHDGAQQRLVALAMQLRVAQGAVPAELDEHAAELGRVIAGLTGALDELREIARGIHPAILAKGGLVPALRTLARRSAVPVQLGVRPVRLPERIEVATYYVVSEALTNAAKHANASVVRVIVEMVDGVLHVLVGDDGVGGADPGRGSGLVGLRDRVEATGGTLTVQSRPGDGTRLMVELPVDLGEQSTFS
jgi:signal transduction histidine kinase